MSRHGGGIKRSSQQTFRRRLALARILLREPASAATLIHAVQQELGTAGYPVAANSAIKHDLDVLKAAFGCRIIFRRPDNVYVIEDLGSLAMLKGSNTVQRAIQALETQGAGMPAAGEAGVAVDALLDQLRLLASFETRPAEQ